MEHHYKYLLLLCKIVKNRTKSVTHKVAKLKICHEGPIETSGTSIERYWYLLSIYFYRSWAWQKLK